MQGEMIEFPGSTFGLALNLERDSVGAVVLGAYDHLSEGDVLLHRPHPRSAGRPGNCSDASSFARRAPIDGKGPIKHLADAGREGRPGRHRAPVGRQPVQTGLKAIDAMVPVGRGQRELIIGDRQTGKTAVAIDAIINQKGTGVNLRLRRDRPEEELVDRRRVCASSRARRDGPHHRRRRQCLRSGRHAGTRPYSGCAMGEYFMATAARTPDRLRRPVQAGRRLPPDLAAAAARRVAKPIPATCLPALAPLCWSARASTPTKSRSLTNGEVTGRPAR